MHEGRCYTEQITPHQIKNRVYQKRYSGEPPFQKWNNWKGETVHIYEFWRSHVRFVSNTQ